MLLFTKKREKAIKMGNYHFLLTIPAEYKEDFVKKLCKITNVVYAEGVRSDFFFMWTKRSIVLISVSKRVRADGTLEVSIKGDEHDAFDVFLLIRENTDKEKVKIVNVWRFGM